MARAVSPRDGAKDGGQPGPGDEQRNAELDKVEAACKDVCKPVTTLFTDDKTKPCVSLPEDKLRGNADCIKVYCQAVSDVLKCSKCQFKALGHNPDDGSKEAEYFRKVASEEQGKWCKDTGIDLTKA